VKHGPENAISRVASALKECLSDTSVLRHIDDFFNDLGFEFDPEAWSGNSHGEPLSANIG
jgi:hypothetical protein